jgi:hypothetical protein
LHRIRWADGELTPLDHADPDGERTLAALGGQPMPCIEILDAWQRHRADLDVLLLAGRGPSDHVTTHAVANGPGGVATSFATAHVAPAPPSSSPAVGRPKFARGVPMAAQPAPTGPRPGLMPGWYYGGLSHARGGVASYASHVAFLPDGGDALGQLLLALPGALPDRLVATVVASWAARIAADDLAVAAARPALHAALYGRALAAARWWLGGGVEVEVEQAASPAVTRRADGVVVLALPFSWLRDVWARGLATLAGEFCLTACPDPSGGWTLTTVAADLGQRRSRARRP